MILSTVKLHLRYILWVDGGQLFWSDMNVPFVVCLGLSSYGDDIKPEHMRAFSVPTGELRDLFR